MGPSEDYLAGWAAARQMSQASGSVSPYPPGYNPAAAVVPEPIPVSEPAAPETDEEEE